MNILVALWEMIQNRQTEALQEHIIWRLDPHMSNLYGKVATELEEQ